MPEVKRKQKQTNQNKTNKIKKKSKQTNKQKIFFN